MKLFLVFLRGGIRLGLPLACIRRIRSTRDIRPLPAAAVDVLGVIPDENHIVPIIASPLPPPLDTNPRARVLLLNNGESPFGIRVESIEPPQSLEPYGNILDISDRARQLLSLVPHDAIIGGLRRPDTSDASWPEIVHMVPEPLYRARSLREAP